MSKKHKQKSFSKRWEEFPVSFWRDDTLFFLNDLTAAINRPEVTMDDIKKLFDEYTRGLTKIYRLKKPGRWNEILSEDAIELGFTKCSSTNDENALMFRVPLYLCNVIPNRAQLYTSYGEKIIYDKEEHSSLISGERVLLEIKSPF